MTVFLCAKCGIKLTWDLIALPAVPNSAGDVGRDEDNGRAASTVPPGHYAVEPEPWGAPYVPHPDQEAHAPAQPRGLGLIVQGVLMISAGPRGNIVINPQDAADLRSCGSDSGCCGPSGRNGLNRACPCGAPVATLVADCFGPHELHLDRKRTYATEWF